MKMRSVMSHAFSMIPSAEIPRSSFDRSCGYKTTFDAGYLIPVFVDEALPGDTFNVSMTAFGRLATPIFPIMDNVFLETFFFAVPYRLLWDNWERFNGAQDDPDDSVDFVIPAMGWDAPAQLATGTLADYFGIPSTLGIGNGDTTFTSALPFRAYNLIYNEWFRDENLQDSVVVDKTDADSDPDNYVLLRRGKRHDYFTSCLPWPQKGDSVSIPLGTIASVVSNESYGGTGRPSFSAYDGASGANFLELTGAVANASQNVQINLNAATVAGQDLEWGTSALVADLSSATAATINQLRQAFQVQRLLERDARGGTRYTEIIRAHFGVVSPDARLQRPEYLGGGSSPINIVSVAQTSETDAGTPQGNLAAFGTVQAHGHGFSKSFTEHCVIIGLVNVRADLTYQQGLNRMWSRQTRYDFYWPALSHIGEQAVLNKEIFVSGVNATDDGVFGYQERYAEYKYKPSLITGLLRSNVTAPATTLDAWHLSQDFASLPVLGPEFIVDDPPIDRVIAVPAEPHFIFDAYFKCNCARPMPLYGVPGMIDHF